MPDAWKGRRASVGGALPCQQRQQKLNLSTRRFLILVVALAVVALAFLEILMMSNVTASTSSTNGPLLSMPMRAVKIQGPQLMRSVSYYTCSTRVPSNPQCRYIQDGVHNASALLAVCGFLNVAFLLQSPWQPAGCMWTLYAQCCQKGQTAFSIVWWRQRRPLACIHRDERSCQLPPMDNPARDSQ